MWSVSVSTCGSFVFGGKAKVILRRSCGDRTSREVFVSGEGKVLIGLFFLEYFWRTCVSEAGPPKPRPLGRPASADTTADWAPTQARERGPGTGCGLRGASAPRGRRGLNGLKAGCMSRDSLPWLGTLLLIILYSFSFLCERGKERKKRGRGDSFEK